MMALFTFTFLWTISCVRLYFLLLRKVERADQTNNEARKNWQKSQEAYDRAIRENSEAIAANEKAQERLRQLSGDLTCLN